MLKKIDNIDHKKKYMENREISWLKFNKRVLEEAMDVNLPLFERLKFTAIYANNLDEFFMVRVGSLYDLSLTNSTMLDTKSNMTPQEQISLIYKKVRPLYKLKDIVYSDLIKKLAKYDIEQIEYKDTTSKEKKYLKNYFYKNILPVLSPQIIDTKHPFPFIPNKQTYIIVKLQNKQRHYIGVIDTPDILPKVIYFPGNKIRFIFTSNVIFEYAEKIFTSYKKITEKNIFCVTRNADIDFDIDNDNDTIDINEDFRTTMKKLLKKRKRLAIIRVESKFKLSLSIKHFLIKYLKIKSNQFFISSSPFHMNYIFDLQNKFDPTQHKILCNDEYKPSYVYSKNEKNHLLSFPFMQMKPFLEIIKNSSIDPSVISIKITIYRLSKNSKLVDYLCQAAENGKEVLVLIELRARFDEQNNIDYSEKLESSGCKIIYGFERFKVHSKICLITKKDENNRLKFITQIATGNYNEKTAELYTDLSLITNNQNIGKDASNFFKNMLISDLNGEYNYLLVAPNSMKNKLIELIDNEILKGENGLIIMKFNALTDVDIINKFVEASCAGVTIKLLIRGICCLIPGIKNISENITIKSIVGKFLEHSRIYSFGKDLQQKLYISSADMMTRNLDNRVEIACPIYDTKIKSQINHMLDILFQDNVKARIMNKRGIYYIPTLKKDSKIINSQEIFINKAIKKSNKLK